MSSTTSWKFCYRYLRNSLYFHRHSAVDGKHTQTQPSATSLVRCRVDFRPPFLQFFTFSRLSGICNEVFFLQHFSIEHHALLLRPCLDDDGNIRPLPFFACCAGHVFWCRFSCPSQRTTSIRHLERRKQQHEPASIIYNHRSVLARS
jgi:hypothetical protein